ncbi:hypothetical protein EV649_7879 [Kribbella sp. VKM Ac-2569]|uniref:hypothetical protein n=1 Tax=Kribbella sp. VKM Ac-2569 TaxID=2512220 RepID=UPI00102B7496|nr:hypothetical protein [Kribbella sp. VKM Ac-2569]RZT07948.1 hypothetical protein EV649_7879 [Kribbella sp. VKM Ac-2569]
MAVKTITRIAAIAATIGIAGLPLAITAPASAITKPESGANAPSTRPADSGLNLDLAQIGAGTVGGIAVTGAGFAAVTWLRRKTAQ